VAASCLHTAFPYVFLDATYLHIRRKHAKNLSVLIWSWP